MKKKKHCPIVPLTEERMLMKNRMWQGCPSIECSRKGRLFASWSSGGYDEPSLINYQILAISDDGGLSWRELFAIDSIPDEEHQSWDIQLWKDPDGQLWVFWQERNYKKWPHEAGHLSVWAMTCQDPDAETPVFSEPFYVADGFIRCNPTVLKDGRWLFPVYAWTNEKIQYYESLDKGKTFQQCFAGKRLPADCDENMILERQDASLWMLSRIFGGSLSACESRDGGKTWTDAEKLPIANPTTRFFIGRLPSGRVVFINNDDEKLRKNLKIFLSEDDGNTWKYSMMLDERIDVSYPDLAIGPEGEFYIIHDRSRQGAKEILVSRITEDDIIQGKAMDPSSYQNNIISKAPAKPAIGLWYKKLCKQFFFDFLKEYYTKVEEINKEIEEKKIALQKKGL